MSDLVLGIDLGTTNSVVAVADGGQVRVLSDEAGSRLIPSVVSFHPDGRILVGEEARERRLVDAHNTVYSIKRLIGRPYKSAEVAEAQKRFAFRLKESANGGIMVAVRDEAYTLTEISAFVLREVKRIAEKAIGSPVGRAVITVPAAFNELQRSATKAAGRVAGLDVLRIVNEPTAAALAYGFGKDRPERLAVFDLGGGTFDLTLLELENDVFEVVATAGDPFLGGDDVDLLLADRMCESFLAQYRWDPRSDEQVFERVRAAAEWAKCQLSAQDRVELTIEELAHGSKGESLDLRFATTRAEFEPPARSILERAYPVCERALADAGMKASDVDNVILVGGSTRMPLVRELVKKFFGRPPLADIDPDLVVAQGAAIHGYAIAGPKKAGGAPAKIPAPTRSVEELKAAQAKRKALRAEGPKQPAFAPTAQIDAPFQAPAPAKKAPPAKAAPPKPAAGLPSPPFSLDSLPDLPPAVDRISSIPPGPAMRLPKGIGGLSVPGAPRPTAPKPAGPAKADAQNRSLILDLDDAFAPPAPATVEIELDEEIEELDELIRIESSRPAPPPVAPPAIPRAALRPAGVPSASSIAIDPEYAHEVEVALSHEHDTTSGFEEPELSFGEPELAFDEPELSVGDEDEGLPGLPSIEAHAPAAARPAVAVASVVAVEKPAPVVEMPARPAPILMDVTPHSLGVETVGQYCQHLLRRNVPIPAEHSRVFSTAGDNQTSVVVRICQGESRIMGENQLLGEVELDGLRPATRGKVRVEVTFALDASGILEVRARDVDTKMEQRTRIHLLGGADEAEIEAMRLRQQARLGGA